MTPATLARVRRVLAPARWDEYEGLLREALARGYEVCGIEQWLAAGRSARGPLLILRHDVDQHPRSAVRVARIERAFGICSSFFFRWRTAEPRTIATIRGLGGSIGLHYETLTRLVLEEGITAAEARPRAARLLRQEVQEFARRYGPLRTVAAHGDTRLPEVRNGDLLAEIEPARLGVEFDADRSLTGAGLAGRFTDRPSASGGWEPGSPLVAIAAGTSPLFCLTHPHHWASGLDYASGRGVSRLLPSRAGRRTLLADTDEPPS